MPRSRCVFLSCFQSDPEDGSGKGPYEEKTLKVSCTWKLLFEYG
jgi:hypothetical protein